ncbi:T9SS type A sorting domain-containing protein [Empedobacter falsenii]
MKKIYLSAFTLLMLLNSNAQVYDVGTWAQVTDISNNGVAVGNAAGVLHFKWTKEDGPSVIGELSGSDDYISGNTTISADGTLVSGTMTNPDTGNDELALYNISNNKWEFIGGKDTSAWGMSSNGETLVGLKFLTASQALPIVWNRKDGIKQLPSTFSGKSARANSVNNDGTMVVGWQDGENGFRKGVYWKNGVQTHITDAEGNLVGEALSVSADGNIIAGFNDPEAYIFNVITNAYTKIVHPDPEFSTSIVAISDDGNTAIGYAKPWYATNTDGEGFIWFKDKGMIKVDDYVKEVGFEDKGFTFVLPTGMSPNGEYIGGIGINWEEMDLKGFVIKLKENLATNENVLEKNTTTISPNPVIDELSINTKAKVNAVEVYNLAGQKVWSSDKVMNNKVDLNFLTKGIYIIKVETDTSKESIKFIKK